MRYRNAPELEVMVQVLIIFIRATGFITLYCARPHFLFLHRSYCCKFTVNITFLQEICMVNRVLPNK
jgi:hypothetical protein